MSNNRPLLIQQYGLHLARLPGASKLEQLELQPSAAQQMTWQDHSVHCAFFQPYAEQEQFNNRLVLLLQQLLAKLKAQTGQHAVAAKDIVYLILPEFSGPDNPQLNTLLQQLMRSCPGLLQSEQCRVFPYGSAGALMALNAAQQALQQQPATPIWLLGVDSLCNAGAFADYKAADASYVLSEGAIALCITAADCGLSLLFSDADALACQSDQGEDSAAGALFRQVAQRFAPAAKKLELLYLPDSGDEVASGHWLAQYQWLHGAVTADTAFCLPSYYSGELGACGGLYRLLHLMQAQQKGRLSGLTLQYEQSLRQYRSVAVFSPAGFDH